MSVYLPRRGKTYRYRFRWRGQWYRGSTGQIRKQDAELVDKKEQLRVRQEFGGIAPLGTEQTPRFQDWSEIYYAAVAQKVDRPDRIEDLTRVALRFWGARPHHPTPRDEGQPFYDLRLGDPIHNPIWIHRFERWMTLKGWAGQTKNQYRSVMSQMYVLAMKPLWQKQTHITMNPFAGLERDRKAGREVAMTAEQLRAFLAVASSHVRLAVAIGALAPKLRLASILALRWDTHFDDELCFITVQTHKTVKFTHAPQVIAISQQLRGILKDAQAKARSAYVIEYRGEPIAQLHGGVAGACARAGLPYGRFTPGGITFHVLRHTAATIMAKRDVSEEKRRKAMGWTNARTMQGYTHLGAIDELPAMEQLSDALPIADLVTVAWRRPSVRAGVDPPGVTSGEKAEQKPRLARVGVSRPSQKRSIKTG